MRNEIRYILNRQVWGGLVPFGLSAADRRQHLYMVGKSGTGKSTLLKNLIVQDIQAGEGVALIDPHGDLAEEILDFIPPNRTEHVVYFNPADREYPIGLNLLHAVPPEARHLVASGIVGSFKGIWRDSWGPRLEYILYSAVAALLDVENGTLLGVQRMLIDDTYRQWVVRQVKDVAVRSFWENEFEQYDSRLRAEIISPIQNKVGQLLMAAPLRNILGQVRSKISPRFMMDHGRIFIANLAKGKIGEDKANLLGSFLVTQFQLAAMARADTPEPERRNFYMFIDEFHNFTTDSFASILSEARKYRLCLALSHQYTSQVPPMIRDAVFGNVGTTVGLWPIVAPVGYLNNHATKLIYPDPDRSRFIRTCYDLYATGTFTIDRLRETVNGLGFRSRTGKPLSRSQYHRILENPLYCGIINYGGETYEGRHQTIVGRDLFEQVQKLMQERTNAKAVGLKTSSPRRRV